MTHRLFACAAAVVIAALAACTAPEFAATREVRGVEIPGSAGDEADVLAAEDARFAAMVAGDAEGMRRAFAEDLAYVHSTGNVQGRDELIAAISGGRLRYLALEPVERKVVFLGRDSAYVLGRGHIHAEAAGHEADFQGRYLAIYGRSDGKWRLRAWQSLRLP